MLPRRVSEHAPLALGRGSVYHGIMGREEAESLLESPALGAALSALIERCCDRRRPAHPEPPVGTAPLGVTFSGGGFRATFAALGMVRYLADAGMLHDLRFVSSVSGGSIANAMLATRWPKLREAGFSSAAVDELVIGPVKERVIADSLKSKLIRNVWRAVGRRNRTDVLAWAFDDWLFDGMQLEELDEEARWIFNAANLTTGTRFAFERDVVGDYVTGLADMAGSKLRVAEAVAASAAVPGLFAPMKIRGVDFPCGARGVPTLLDGGAYDNTGLEALDGNRYRDVFTISLNSGGVFVTGRYGKLPLVRDLARSNSLLYRQSTGLRTRWMVERFRAWEQTPEGQHPPRGARQGVLFGLATTFDRNEHAPEEFRTFIDTHPEHRTFHAADPKSGQPEHKDLAFVPTVFDRLDPALVDALVYRGWWLTGAALARYHPGRYPIADDIAPPPVDAP